MLKALFICIFTTLVTYNEAQRYFVTGPNIFRLNVEETVSVQVWQSTKVEVYLQDANKANVISKVTKDMTASKPEIFKLKITGKDLPKAFDRGKLHYFLVVKGNGFQKQTPVLLDLRGGTVFIQTDKPIYTPKDKVRFRVIPVGLDLLPMKQKVMVEIMCDSGYVGRTSQRLVDGIRQHVPSSIRQNSQTPREQPSRSFKSKPLPKSYDSSIRKHPLENPECAKWHGDDMFQIIGRARRDLLDFAAKGILTNLFVSFSRDEHQADDAPKYVQDNLQLQQELIMELIFEKNAIVYVCGDISNMARDVYQSFVTMIMKSRGVSEQQAMDLIRNLREKERYLEDIWC